ncbi:dihydroorotate dehydrogenase B catalytic subunit [Candidatus Marsarchaeota G1 archaeon OSP_D]|jgi:dihydroorotate dehydrogenase (NAD+) catalytic subunit|uniref:Dihydroorotate dehydrogenase n=4 Tax=Candidatus Marsarchaeota group 1 TaxID=2203770 RepID=A0A2R6AJA5_9ARCH|nr:MAG: dihydroorotate dehydrogenase B catalytic subunit [Candidatus Marsarchaeota G1 archaeon OSP_D]PSN86428.1 MAG: dihydroorotate dehydrogenase B catalytic subunit [Candidatus Marsarchaeota G1 archaeon BE_D]PSN89317.1 MAG: dihydroorotate dehydrogenase B catalytic subunit [Candidatus Marsarchaeota G1 archaeon OSP_C]
MGPFFVKYQRENKLSKVDLSQEMGRLFLSAPFAIASGLVANEHSVINTALENGVPALVTKSVFLSERVGYPPPVYYECEHYSINAVGLPSKGVSHFLSEIKKVKHVQRVVVSVGGFSVEEYEKVCSEIAQNGVKALELNLSCPHVKGTGSEIASNPQLVEDVTRAVKNVAKHVTLFVKLPPDASSITEIARAALKGGADGFTATNTLRGMVFDCELEAPVLSNMYGGVSGRALHPVSVYCVYELRKNFPETPIFGVGGVYTLKDALDFFLAGANAVQVGTAFARSGYSLFHKLTLELHEYLESKGYSSFKEFTKKKRWWF